MKQWFIDNLYNLVVTFLGGTSLFGYLLERRKRRIEEDEASSNALRSMQEAYDKFTQDYLTKYKDLNEEIENLKKKLVEVTKQLDQELLKYQTLQFNYNELYKQLNNSKITKDVTTDS